MIGRKPPKDVEVQQETRVGPRGFDDFDLRLGDVMRGERATMGKSLLDVQRELRIKASYIAAIENCDPSAFDTPGFIAGYVRSYARYLGMDPDETFRLFCEESGFSTAHGMSDKASSLRKPRDSDAPRPVARDPLAQPNLPFAPSGESVFSQIEPSAVGSVLVLVALIGGIGYGGWSVLQEVQRVQLAPVDQTPVVLSDLDPLDTAIRPVETDGAAEPSQAAGVFSPPSNEALDRLYRPEALDVPVLVARDAPISTLDPDTVGAFARPQRPILPDLEGSDDTLRRTIAGVAGGLDGIGEARSAEAPGMPKVLEDSAPGVTMIAVRPAWVRVRAADGSVIFESIMNAGDTYQVPQTEEPPSLRVGESGAIYFAVNGQTYGPVGPQGSVTSNLALSVDNLTGTYQVADIQQDADLQRVVAELNAGIPAAE